MFTYISMYLIYTNTHTYIYVEKENKRRGEERRLEEGEWGKGLLE